MLKYSIVGADRDCQSDLHSAAGISFNRTAEFGSITFAGSCRPGHRLAPLAVAVGVVPAALRPLAKLVPRDARYAGREVARLICAVGTK